MYSLPPQTPDRLLPLCCLLNVAALRERKAVHAFAGSNTLVSLARTTSPASVWTRVSDMTWWPSSRALAHSTVDALDYYISRRTGWRCSCSCVQWNQLEERGKANKNPNKHTACLQARRWRNRRGRRPSTRWELLETVVELLPGWLPERLFQLMLARWRHPDRLARCATHVDVVGCSLAHTPSPYNLTLDSHKLPQAMAVTSIKRGIQPIDPRVSVQNLDETFLHTRRLKLLSWQSACPGRPLAESSLPYVF